MVTPYDKAWYFLHQVIYISKKVNLAEAREEFPKVYKEFEEYFKGHILNDKIRTYYFSNKAVFLKDEEQWLEAVEYSQKTIDFGKNEYYSRHEVFTAHLHLAEAYSELERFREAAPVLKNARQFWDKSDSISSQYLQYRYSSIYYYEKAGKYDSAYLLMKNANRLDRMMDFRKNSLRISELNVQLEVAQKEKEVVINTFIYSNFNYCSLIWHFCSCQSSNYIELIQKRCLKLLLDDNESDYKDLLQVS